MSDLVVIVPSRGRPDAARELVQAFADTCTAHTDLLLALDEDDPTREAYPRAGSVGCVVAGDSHCMGDALKAAVERLMAQPPFAVGFMGDDHRPRTHGWDAAYLAALQEMGTGIVYGDDLLQGENLPTQVAMTSDIIGALGFMAPPTLKHLYFDNFWRDLGIAAGYLRYLPDVIVEHMHPVARKAEWDEGYMRVNSPQMYERDATAYRDYHLAQFAADVAKVRAL